MKAILKTTLLMAAMLGALSACTIVDRKDYLQDANAGRPLDVPPDLAQPQTDGEYNVPQGASAPASQAAAPACACQQAAPAARAGKERPLDMPPELVLPQGVSQAAATDTGEGTGSATYSDYARRGLADTAGCTCQQSALAAPATAAAPADTVKVSRSADGRSIQVGEPFDRCWHRVGQALERTDIRVMDKDRSKGLFYLTDGAQLRVQGKADAPSCAVSFAGRNGVYTDDSQRQTEVLLKALAK